MVALIDCWRSQICFAIDAFSKKCFSVLMMRFSRAAMYLFTYTAGITKNIKFAESVMSLIKLQTGGIFYSNLECIM